MSAKSRVSVVFFGIIMMMVLFLAVNCSKHDNVDDKKNDGPALVPEVTTTEVEFIEPTNAQGGGNVVSDNGYEITARGVCWSKTTGPTIADGHTIDWKGTGLFTSFISPLEANTTYYLRAYATNQDGTGYGNEVVFTTKDFPYGPPVSDIDGNVYKTIHIANQLWMAENLKTTRYNDGVDIPYVPDCDVWQTNSVTNPTPMFGWYDSDETANKDVYGGLYNWTVVESGKLCPVGWRAPTIDDITLLANHLGSVYFAGGKMKASGAAYWNAPNPGATNSSGFSALPGGYRQSKKSHGAANAFVNLGRNAIFWGMTDYGHEIRVVSFSMWHSSEELTINEYSFNGNSANRGHSVRCIKVE